MYLGRWREKPTVFTTRPQGQQLGVHNLQFEPVTYNSGKQFNRNILYYIIIL